MDPGEANNGARPEQRPVPTRARLTPDLELREEARGTHGMRYVRVIRRAPSAHFRRLGPGLLEASSRAGAPTGGVAGAWGRLKRLLIGPPLATAQQAHERLTKVKALAVLSSDALSSVAYATEQTLLILILAGTAALWLSLPVAACIILLLAIVTFSYRQTIHAYPKGGGSYIVSKENLGVYPGLTAGAALLIDYTLTVAVSVSAGVAAITSAFPPSQPYRVEMCLLFVLLITLGNLRGIRESGTIFAAPTYLFIGCMYALIAVGLVRLFYFGDQPLPEPTVAPVEGLGLFLILRAFASGATALTGVEAISDGVPAFKPPESRNAATTLVWMSVVLGTTFAGITYLAHAYQVVPKLDETVLSQLARHIFGQGPIYYLIQVATTMILVLAANTSFSDFPRLSYFLARDGFMPHVYMNRGDKLAYSVGIITLAVLASILLLVFRGETDALIPLYAVGVFTSFTLSQSGMVARWRRLRGPHWRKGLVINAAGACTTALVLLIVAATKFIHGAWIVIILIPLLIAMFRAIHWHYERMSREMAVEIPTDPARIRHTILVPIAGLTGAARQTLAYARSISKQVTAIHVTDDRDELVALRKQWQDWTAAHPWAEDIKLVGIESPYRAVVGPILAYIDAVDQEDRGDTLTVILPEFVATYWWEHLLHNQTALRLKAALLFRPGTVVTSVPYHLRKPSPAPSARA